MPDVFCDAVRTPIGRYGGVLARVRADDLAAIPIRELVRRHPGLDTAVDEVLMVAPTRPARTTGTWPAWRSSSRGSRTPRRPTP
jgi:acetyl-CoA acetyltransferase